MWANCPLILGYPIQVQEMYGREMLHQSMETVTLSDAQSGSIQISLAQPDNHNLKSPNF